ncbi:RagB/SusD family nutrient uptake outer membrane protein [Arcicella sp. LKC2W]|uniref:RagB/SusD family nutrient uptake outer membrane protein n=1 Tax=Arcicella sp. LKC2W TaxID=2984198 RepID=UPI002B20B882|nr:RagB/SusD family nutrient uptake outer membrane protein [Arcicella sp. LKC2W]MEA5460637.1 RagB/SusD family nutrient uptake outer membrane protein [Arcicella sp. LKC2W]
MKINNKLIFAVAFSLMLTSCADKLDVNPIDDVDAISAVKTSSDVEALLTGAYDSMTDADVLGGNLQRDAELIADNGDIEWQGTFVAPGEVFSKSLLKDNNQAQTTWLDSYRTINITNNVLANLAVVETAKKSRIEGEAKLIRAWMHFELVRQYAKTYLDGTPTSNLGVPILTTPTTIITETNFVKRNTVAEVYQAVIADLTSAESLLPAGNGFFADKYTAAALLSRVYLMQGNYEGARQAAHRVIASGNYTLNASFFDVFNNKTNTTEDIFAAQATDQDYVNSYNTFFGSTSQGGRGDIIINEQHLNAYDVSDDRGLFFYESGDIYTAKWAVQVANIPLIRLAEMYLTRAEGNLRAGGTPIGTTPLADINRLRDRVGAKLFTTVDLATILKERRLELAFEGHWIHDIKRNKQTISKRNGTATQTWAFDSPKLIFPIPLREIDANKNLVQNEGYQ